MQSRQSKIQSAVSPRGVFYQGQGQMLGSGRPILVSQGLERIGLKTRPGRGWSGFFHAAIVSSHSWTNCRTLSQSLGRVCRKSRAERYHRVVSLSVPQRQSGA